MTARRRVKPAEAAWKRWSASKLTAATACPLRAFYEVILEEPTPNIPIACFGQALHYLFKLFLTPHRSTKRFPYSDVHTYEHVWKHFWWSAVRGAHGFGSRGEPPTQVAWAAADQPDHLFAQGMKILQQFHTNFSPLRTDGRPRWAEKRFLFTWHGFTLSGLLDLLELDPDGAIITDHKNGRYAPHLLETGLQMTMYQLAYEACFRRRMPGRPPLKAIRIHDYRSGIIQDAPLRPEREFGLLLAYLTHQAAYFEGVLTGRRPHPAVLPVMRALDWQDIERGDITPNLPRGDHCTYCRHFQPCRERELALERPSSRAVFQAKHQLRLLELAPTLTFLPFTPLPVVTDGTLSYHRLMTTNEVAVDQQLTLAL